MAYEKFDQHQNGRYWDNYFNKGIEFYRLIQEHMKESLVGRKTEGLDIGAGPGVGAKLAAGIGLETILTGYEPSETHNDGKILSNQLKSDNSPTIYLPKKRGIETISEIKEESLDYIIILRACHEIIDSIGSKDQFIEYLNNAKKLLKQSGKIIISEPQFSPEITNHPENYQAIIKAVQEYQRKTIGHTHNPQDYISFIELERMFQQIGLTLEKRNILEHKPVLQYLIEQGYDLKQSPNIFYVETFAKRKKDEN
jgi:SAM-dependent methyltransferase